MLRRTFCFFAASTAQAGGGALSEVASAEVSPNKLTVLHKLLTGEVHFRNKALLKVCNIEFSFGANWKAEIEAYAAKLPKKEGELLRRQIARVHLTRFTTRELATYAGEGPSYVDQLAREANLAQGKAYLDKHGLEAFEKYVKTEAKNANWSDDDCGKFIAAVKALK